MPQRRDLAASLRLAAPAARPASLSSPAKKVAAPRKPALRSPAISGAVQPHIYPKGAPKARAAVERILTPSAPKVISAPLATRRAGGPDIGKLGASSTVHDKPRRDHSTPSRAGLLQTCKERPSTRKKSGGGSGPSRAFVPWCR